MRTLLGLDIGSSSVKGALIRADDGSWICSAQSPAHELEILSPKPGWAEQDPATWWHHALEVIKKLKEQAGSLSGVQAIGISYQMHGLVVVDDRMNPLRPSIIWCDSRADAYGQGAWSALGREWCLQHLLNNPANFTAAKLAWVRDQQPEIYHKIYKMMLPGDFIAMKLTGSIQTTPSGLSEGIFWDFSRNGVSSELLDHLGFDAALLPEVVPVFARQAAVSTDVARLTGLPEGIPVAYRAGDQPNNALSLNVLNPGEVAATAGTSGVIYGILDRVGHDPASRVNIFAHVNHGNPDTRLGVLLCVNGTGIQYAWLRRLLGNPTYPEMNSLAEKAEPGAAGIRIFPFGNGVERIHQNKPFGGVWKHLDFNRHGKEQLIRAAQEGIIFALNYGFEAMQEMGVRTETVRAGHANLFLSDSFATIFSSVTGTLVELYDTDGAIGAARGAGIGAGLFSHTEAAFTHLKKIRVIEPSTDLSSSYREIYEGWKTEMQSLMKINNP